MKAILMSIHPVWCEKIFSWIKTIEVRKTRPKLMPPFKVYVYTTATKERFPLWEYVTAYQDCKGNMVNGSQKVIGSFVCDFIEECIPDCDPYTEECFNYYFETGNDCLSEKEIREYGNGRNLYGWHIKEPKLFDTPKKLSEFRTPFDCEAGRNMGCWLDYCKNHNFDCVRRVNNPLTRPPQSWCYVEEQK